MQVIFALGAVSQCVGSHQLVLSLPPSLQEPYLANNQQLGLVQAVIGGNRVAPR
jgi:hypothetical protein